LEGKSQAIQDVDACVKTERHTQEDAVMAL